MKHAVNFLLVVGVVGILAIPLGSEAGWFDKSNKSSGDAEKVLAPRYDNYPSTVFQLGTLTRDGWTGWQLDGFDIQFTPDCVVVSNGEGPGALTEGRQAIVTGSLVGNMIVARRVTVLNPNWDMGPKNYDEEVIWSDSNPSVGVGHGPS